MLKNRSRRLFSRWLQGNMVLYGGESPGNEWFVDTVSGAASNGGLGGWTDALLTMTAALAKAADDDLIWFRGTLVEACTCALNGIQFIGANNSPQGNIWMESAADDDLITLTGERCSFENIRFRIPTAGGRGIVMSGADYTRIDKCRFQGRTGSEHGVTCDGTSDNVLIRDSEFLYLNTATDGCGIFGHTYTADVCGSGWRILHNFFHSNLRHVFIRLRQSFIQDNIFPDVGLAPGGGALTATTKLNIGGAQTMWNYVTNNIMMGDYSNTGGYTAGATNDNWFGNLADDTTEAEVTADGRTIGVPAA